MEARPSPPIPPGKPPGHGQMPHLLGLQRASNSPPCIQGGIDASIKQIFPMC